MKIFGLVGKNLGHSWSKNYFEDKFRRERITNSRYEYFPMEDISGLWDLISENNSIAGLNVTLPFKEEVLKMLDVLDSDAEAIGAVNCIRITRDNKRLWLEGLNTDAPAFLRTLEPFRQKAIDKALILGTGGAAKAVAHALGIAGIEFSTVSRTSGKANLIYEALTPDIIREHRLIINATPAGMQGFEDRFPRIPYEALGVNHILYDLVYNPTETTFLIRGRLAGAVIVNGLEMLKIQAELSWQAWNT